MSAQSEIVQFFEGKVGKIGAAGIAGNTRQESSDNPGETGGGLFQDIGSRAPSGTGSKQHQLEAAWLELQRSPNTLAKLKAAKTPQEAARVFSEEFERPGDPELTKRENYAIEAYADPGEGPGTGPGNVIQEAKSTVNTVKGTVEGALNGIKSTAAFLEALTEPSTWLRLAEGVGGIVLFMVGLKTLTKGSAAAGAVNVAVSQGHGVRRAVKRTAEAAAVVAK